MIGIYFSGTGNTKHCVDMLLSELESGAKSLSIEDETAVPAISESEEIVLGYPVYFSNIPKIVREFLDNYGKVFNGKKVFIICTMGLFSGDGAGCSARILKKYGAEIIGGLHLKMPDCIGDNKLLKKSEKENAEIISATEEKIRLTAKKIKNGKYPKNGLSFLHRLAGLFGQRLYFYNKPLNYCKTVSVDSKKCVSCGICGGLCPMKNISIEDNKVVFKDRCTACYRCFSHCPKQAITVMGKKFYTQYYFEEK
ncbi:MAG: EFR1 family ferrodoxin [Clostridia bacterium]|nr:EFR1 family ferrodoxin [Clostridia bacterium]